MKNRTKAYANRIAKLCSTQPYLWIAQTLGRQLLRRRHAELSITHKFCGQSEAQLDVIQPGEAKPHNQ